MLHDYTLLEILGRERVLRACKIVNAPSISTIYEFIGGFEECFI